MSRSNHPTEQKARHLWAEYDKAKEGVFWYQYERLLRGVHESYLLPKEETKLPNRVIDVNTKAKPGRVRRRLSFITMIASLLSIVCGLFVYSNFNDPLKVTSLNLSEQKLTQLPLKIADMKNLQELNLSGNRLDLWQAMPLLKKLKKLKILDLSDNELEVLPKSLGQLTNLTTLDLSRNKLSDLSIETEQLKKLQYLDLDNNNLRRFPAEINKLIHLQSVSLSHNKLSVLPRLDSLKNLRELNLSLNNFTTLPGEIKWLPKLTHLYLGYNSIDSLPEEMEKLQCLTFLYLNNNQLTTVPKVIARVRNLKKLDIRKNNIKSLSNKTIETLKNVQEMHWDRNKLLMMYRDISDEIFYRKIKKPSRSHLAKTNLKELKLMEKRLAPWVTKLRKY